MLRRSALSLPILFLALAACRRPPHAGAAPGPPSAILHTTAGDMKCDLFPDKAPKAVANFIGLAKGTKDWTNPATGKLEHNHPLYDGVIFHRVIPEFMIQGGDPTGTGSGNVGYKFEDELLPDLLFDRPGRLAMANAGPNTNSSQFFITEKAVPFLNPRGSSGYTIFGQCDDSAVELVKKIARMPRGAQDMPADPVKIQHIEILNGSGKPAPPKPASSVSQ